MTPNVPTTDRLRRTLFWITRYFYVFVGIFLVAVVAGAYFLVFRPQIDRLANINLFTYRESLATLNQLKAERASVERIIGEWQNVSPDDWQLLTDLLPGRRDIPGILMQLEAIANQSGVQLAGITVGEATVDQPAAKSGDPVGELMLSVTVTNGGYGQVKRFVELVETNLRLMDIRSLSFTGATQSSVTVNITTYFIATPLPASPPVL